MPACTTLSRPALTQVKRRIVPSLIRRRFLVGAIFLDFSGARPHIDIRDVTSIDLSSPFWPQHSIQS